MISGLSRVLKAPREGRFSLSAALAVAAGFLLFVSWLTTEHFLPWVSWHAEVPVFFGVFLVAFVLVIHRSRSAVPRRFHVPFIALPFAFIAVLALGQVLSGVMMFGGDAAIVWFYCALCIVCLMMGFNFRDAVEANAAAVDADSWRCVELLAVAFVVGALASATVAFAQTFDLWPYSAHIVRMEESRPGGNLAQPNQLATLLVMGVASIAYLQVSGRLSNLPAAIAVFVVGIALAATQSRSGLIGLAAVLAWWQWKRPLIAAARSPWLAPALGVSFLFMYLAWPHLLDGLQLLNGSPESRISHGDIRLAMWAQLLEAALQRPWFGWGILEVAEAHNSVADAHAVNNPFSYSHNLVMDWALWMGIPVAVALTVLTGVWVQRRLIAARDSTSWYCLAIAAPLGVHSMLELPYAYAYFLAPVLFLLGVLEASLGIRPAMKVAPKPILLALLMLGGAMTWSVVEYFEVEEDFRIVRFEQLRVGRTASDHHPPHIVMLTQLGALLDGSRLGIRPGMPAEELEQLRKLALRYPWVATQYRYALALALNNGQAEAIRQFQVIRRQRDEKLYQKIRKEVSELANTRYPELRSLQFP